jgi:hypothetical protein
LTGFPLFKTRIVQEFIGRCLGRYSTILNFLHEDTQAVTIEWTKFLGFEVARTIENHNNRGGRFLVMEMVAEQR